MRVGTHKGPVTNRRKTKISIIAKTVTRIKSCNQGEKKNNNNNWVALHSAFHFPLKGPITNHGKTKMKPQMSYDPHSWECNFSNRVVKTEKFRTSTGFEPVTSRYRCDAVTN